MTLSTRWLLVLTGCISTGASLAGGLIMYFQALDLLESTVEEIGLADMQSIGLETGGWFNVTHATLMRYKDLLERLNWSDADQFKQWFKESAISDVYRDYRISTVGLRGYNIDTLQIFFAASWYDILRESGAKSYVYALQKAHSDEVNCTDNCAEARAIDPTTGEVGMSLYEFGLGVRHDPVFDQHPPGTYIWRKQVIWYSDTLLPYNYLPYQYLIRLPGHPFLNNYRLILDIDMMTDQWGDLFDTYKTEAKLVITEVNAGVQSQVLSGNFPETRVNITNVNLRPVMVFDLGDPYTSLIVALNRSKPDVFTNDEGYWMMKTLLHGKKPSDDLTDVYLMWFRAKSSINGRLNKALFMLLGFCVGVFMFDLSLVLLEIFLVAQPLIHLSRSVVHMTCMDLESAKVCLHTPGQLLYLSEVLNLHKGLDFALDSLGEYRTFLPQSILAHSNDNAEVPYLATSIKVGDLASAPSGDTGCFIVFTDVLSSTTAWEVMGPAMKQAMRIHNDLIRETIAEYEGYEVKTIGDAFMIAFHRGLDACNFGLAVQIKLVKAQWPEDVYQYDCYQKDDSGAWGGLRIRIGIHCGPVERELNQVAQRYDYLGTNVNKAARVESVCIPGAVAVTKEVLESLVNPLAGSSGSETLLSQLVGDAVVVPLGPKELRGCSGSTVITLLVPSLGTRLRDIERAARKMAFMDAGKKQGKWLGSEDGTMSNRSQSRSYADTGNNAMTVAANPYPMKLRERLDKANNVTIGWVSLSYKHDISEDSDPLSVVCEDFDRITSIVERSDAVLQTLVGTCCIVTWNVTRPCPSYLSNSVRFAGLLAMSFSSPGKDIFTGICHGHVLSGNVGANGMRFSTVLGPPVTFASYLSASASDYCIAGLFTSLNSRSLTGVKSYIRPVDEWEVKGSSKTYLIFEVRMQSHDDNVLDLIIDLEDCHTHAPWGWTDNYTKCFHAADFEAIMANAVDDTFLATVAEMLEHGKHMRKAIRV